MKKKESVTVVYLVLMFFTSLVSLIGIFEAFERQEYWILELSSLIAASAAIGWIGFFGPRHRFDEGDAHVRTDHPHHHLPRPANPVSIVEPRRAVS